MQPSNPNQPRPFYPAQYLYPNPTYFNIHSNIQSNMPSMQRHMFHPFYPPLYPTNRYQSQMQPHHHIQAPIAPSSYFTEFTQTNKKIKKNKEKITKKKKNQQCEVIDLVNESKEELELRNVLCKQWMDLDNKIDDKMRIVRSQRNCIINYKIKKINIESRRIKDEVIDIKTNKYGKHSIDWCKDTEDTAYIKLNRINLNKEHSLDCPYCGVYLQCLPLGQSRLAFLCFNYPRCTYPLDDIEYQNKFVWDNVEYDGAVMNSKYEDELLCCKKEDDIDLTFGEIHLASFGWNKHEYTQWMRSEDGIGKKLKEQINWKHMMRKKRWIKLNKEYHQLKLKAKRKD